MLLHMRSDIPGQSAIVKELVRPHHGVGNYRGWGNAAANVRGFEESIVIALVVDGLSVLRECIKTAEW